MPLVSVGLENYRNYKKIQAGVDSDLVLILGENSAGKTNFLESIYFLSRLKSFRAPDELLVKNLDSHFSLTADCSGQKLEVIVQIQPSVKRQFKIDGQKITRSFWKPFPVVLFVPNDLNIFHLGPILRRKFLDETLSQLDQAYVLDLESLDHILKQKSALLERIYQGQEQPQALGFWNEQLAPVVFRVTARRLEFVNFLNAKLSEKINQLTGFAGQFRVDYKHMEAANENVALENLRSHIDAEVRSGKNLVGPHKDDFTIQKNDELNLYNSSRGELRAQVLSLKLLQAEYLSRDNKKPIILLDDVFSELDELRRTKLIENLSGHQIFITSTEEHHLPKIAKDALILKVENNEIK